MRGANYFLCGRLTGRLSSRVTRSRKSSKFGQRVELHVATNALEAAQKAWIREHTNRLNELVRLSKYSGLELVSGKTGDAQVNAAGDQLYRPEGAPPDGRRPRNGPRSH